MLELFDDFSNILLLAIIAVLTLWYVKGRQSNPSPVPSRPVVNPKTPVKSTAKTPAKVANFDIFIDTRRNQKAMARHNQMGYH
jgi:hypothetical protein